MPGEPEFDVAGPLSLPRVVGTCRVCGGEVVEVLSNQFNPELRPVLFGPGSKCQYTTVPTYHCSSCKLVYTAPPPELPETPKETAPLVLPPKVL